MGLRVLSCALLFGLYLYVWSPYGRPAVLQHVGAPLLERVAAPSWTVAVTPDAHRLSLSPPPSAPSLVPSSSTQSIRHTAPAGVRFLLPALGLVLLAPGRLYWLALWGGHVALGLLDLGFLTLGVAGLSFGFVLHDFTTAYLIDALSLAAIVLAMHHELDLTRSLSPPG
jgi:hypothetical protein